MKFLALFVFIISTASLALSEKPSVDCTKMQAESGKKFSELYVPHEANCNRFYQCTDHGLVELKCLKNLVFFPYINGCADQATVDCITWSQWRSLNQ